MDAKPRLLVFAGSTRTDSFNKKLAVCAARQLETAGAIVTVIDLRDYPMPLYDGDIEQREGLPKTAIQLKELMAEQDGFLISSPEYNSGMSAVLKNTIDWVSRPHQEGETSLRAFKGKTAAIVSASPGRLGGLRGLVHLRMVLGNIGVTVIPTQFALAGAAEAFTSDGQLRNSSDADALSAVTGELMQITSGLQVTS